MESSKGTARARYDALYTQRELVLKRARDASGLTITSLIPREGFNETSDLPQPYQSVGARGVRNLASKLVMALFPTNTPFFKYTIDEIKKEEMDNEVGFQARGEIEKALSRRERIVMKEVETSYFRTAAFEVFKHLIIAGNCLIHVPEEGSALVYGLDKYVVSRDPSGTVLEIVLKQCFSPSTLPDEAKMVLQQNPTSMGMSSEKVDLFTYIRRTNKGKYEIYQEVADAPIPNTRRVYNEDILPWRALRLTKMDGEDYGRGYVEDFIGDLISLEGLSQTLLEGTAVISKIITLVMPGGSTTARDIAEAENGAVISGNPEEVRMLQAEKSNDLRVAQMQIQELTQRLSYAFMMNTAIQRDAERVTAQEIRYMAQELESQLGGMYSLLSQEFQMPMVKIFERRMERNRQVPPLPKDVTTPMVVTGMDALGRGQDLNNLEHFLGGLGEVMGPEIQKYINFDEYIARRAAALGIDVDNLIKTAEEIQQVEQQAQMMGLAQNMGPQAIQAYAQMQGKEQEGLNKLAVEKAKKEE